MTHVKDKSIRSQIRKEIESIQPIDLVETEHIAFTLNWLDSGKEIFRTQKPAIPDPHLVSYFLLVDQDAKKVLLVDHKKAELWLPTGGHVELLEHPKNTVQREIIEELGVPAKFFSEDPLFVTVTKTQGTTQAHTDITLWYVLHGNSFFEYIFDSEEFTQIGWFCPSSIPYPRTDPHLKRFIQKLVLLKII